MKAQDHPFFSIIVVSLNAGKKLSQTVESIRRQTYTDFEIIVKDGCSADDSIGLLPRDDRLCVIEQKDKSIYDGMNQGIDYVTGDFILFMNCGDHFYNNNVLQECADYISSQAERKAIFYGDCYTANRNSTLKYPEFTDYLCFTMVLCHQSTFYSSQLFRERKFNLKYKMAADYEYYVHAYKHGIKLIHLPIIVATYMGDGASETAENRWLSLEERKKILKENYSLGDYRRIWLKTQLHGVGIKHFLVRQEWFYPIYKKIAEAHYKKNQCVR